MKVATALKNLIKSKEKLLADFASKSPEEKAQHWKDYNLNRKKKIKLSVDK